MIDRIRDENIDFLFECILKLESVEECYAFFGDLSTVAELKEMSKRMKAARMLKDNAVYSTIVKETGLSSATISRVNRSLKYGNDGYDIVFNRLEDNNE
ncbi:MAG: TrpR-like protein, YerC/YecD [Clostridia bacterium]|nr:TrpR-like protein, YerC/YecD [Clostridia bacterium]